MIGLIDITKWEQAVSTSGCLACGLGKPLIEFPSFSACYMWYQSIKSNAAFFVNVYTEI
jgi:hypothetical protein